MGRVSLLLLLLLLLHALSIASRRISPNAEVVLQGDARGEVAVPRKTHEESGELFEKIWTPLPGSAEDREAKEALKEKEKEEDLVTQLRAAKLDAVKANASAAAAAASASPGRARGLGGDAAKAKSALLLRRWIAAGLDTICSQQVMPSISPWLPSA